MINMTKEQAQKAYDLLCRLWAEQRGCKIVEEDDDDENDAS